MFVVIIGFGLDVAETEHHGVVWRVLEGTHLSTFAFSPICCLCFHFTEKLSGFRFGTDDDHPSAKWLLGEGPRKVFGPRLRSICFLCTEVDFSTRVMNTSVTFKRLNNGSDSYYNNSSSGRISNGSKRCEPADFR